MNANIAKYLTKGTLVELYGRIGINSYINLQGEAQGRLLFHVNNIKLYGKGKGGASNAQQPSAQLTEPVDDLPFWIYVKPPPQTYLWRQFSFDEFTSFK